MGMSGSTAQPPLLLSNSDFLFPFNQSLIKAPMNTPRAKAPSMARVWFCSTHESASAISAAGSGGFGRPGSLSAIPEESAAFAMPGLKVSAFPSIVLIEIRCRIEVRRAYQDMKSGDCGCPVAELFNEQLVVENIRLKSMYLKLFPSYIANDKVIQARDLYNQLLRIRNRYYE